MTRRFSILLPVFMILTGCGHLTFNLKAHEEHHCRDDFKIPQSHWHYYYRDNVVEVCQILTGLVFVDACAESIDGECYIYLPQ